MSETAEPKPGTGRCGLCGEDVPTLDLISHLCVMHPDVYEPVQTWPDGRPVVIDESLMPEDFLRGQS